MQMIAGWLRRVPEAPFRLWRRALMPDLRLPDPASAQGAAYVVRARRLPGWFLPGWFAPSLPLSGGGRRMVPLVWADAGGLRTRNRFAVEWNAVNQIDLMLDADRASGLWFELRTPATRRIIEIALARADVPPECAVQALRAVAERHGAFLRPMSLRTREHLAQQGIAPPA